MGINHWDGALGMGHLDKGMGMTHEDRAGEWDMGHLHGASELVQGTGLERRLGV